TVGIDRTSGSALTRWPRSWSTHGLGISANSRRQFTGWSSVERCPPCPNRSNRHSLTPVDRGPKRLARSAPETPALPDLAGVRYPRLAPYAPAHHRRNQPPPVRRAAHSCRPEHWRQLFPRHGRELPRTLYSGRRLGGRGPPSTGSLLDVSTP